VSSFAIKATAENISKIGRYCDKLELQTSVRKTQIVTFRNEDAIRGRNEAASNTMTKKLFFGNPGY
jgi:transcription initiation factor TFIIIB Brf1 subunit/transcription initiation factor TFIIB